MSSNKKVIAVLGSTGAQGGGLVRAIVADGQFTARALARDPTSSKAKELQQMGVEVVQAEWNSEETISKAVQGCYGMYCVTPLLIEPEEELVMAKNMASAARNNGIKHVILATLEDIRLDYPLEDTVTMPTLHHGKYKVPEFDVKADAEKFFEDLPTTYLLPGNFYDNFCNELIFPPAKGPDGKYRITTALGEKKIPCIASVDIGKCGLGIFKRPELIGKRIGIASEHLTFGDMCARMTKAVGVEIVHNALSFDEFRKLPFHGAAGLGSMFQWMYNFESKNCGLRNIEETRKLNPELMSFDQWLANNKDHIKFKQ